MKKILILGGTGFVGRILSGRLLTDGYNVTLFNRGKMNPDLFPEAKKIIGDRNSDDINQLSTGDWDSVVDFSCMFPDSLDKVTDLLKGRFGRYIFVSTASVYPMDIPELWQKPVKEELETVSCTAEQSKDPDVMATYSNKKAECERVLLKKEMIDSVIFRPGLIYGRFDPTDRFYYWLYKVNKQDKFLIPDYGRDKSTNTYSEDFALLIKAAIDTEKHDKIYNAVTHTPVSIKEYIDISCKLLGKSPELVNASTEFLDENQIQPWGDLPIWLHGMDLCLDYSKALKDFGVKYQSFEESVKGCINYYSSLDWPVPKYGISAEKETELMKKLSM